MRSTPSTASACADENLVPRLSIDSDGGIILRDNAGRERWTTKSDGSFSVKDASGNVTVWSSYTYNFTKIFCPSASNMALGVDSGGGHSREIRNKKHTCKGGIWQLRNRSW